MIEKLIMVTNIFTIDYDINDNHKVNATFIIMQLKSNWYHWYLFRNPDEVL